MKTSLVLFFFLVCTSALADLRYYSPELTKKLNTHSLKNDFLKNELFNRLSSNQSSLGYDGARRALFGKLYLKNDGGNYYIEDVYCQKKFGRSVGVGPNSIPSSDKINCEHTWPQSKFTSEFPKDLQKADLHHLYPTDSRANSIRGNMNFTDVSHDSGELDETNCNTSKFGNSATGGQDGFEPPLKHKGNVARSLFYFSVRYKISIPAKEEETLRRWNELDPVDDQERMRNDEIEKLQGNRNPFIDFPGLANDINKF